MVSHSISRDSLLSLEQYSRQRLDWRTRVIPHKKLRTVHLGPDVRLQFEDEFTVRYQIQEMLRVEKTFEEAGILDELQAYGPLVPTGSHLKATMMIEYADPDLRATQLAKMIGIEHQVWVRIEGFDKVFAIADEDLERSNEVKTSSVHFLRFEFTPAMRDAAKGGAGIAIGCDHAAYRVAIEEIAPQVAMALAKDFA
jgi:hypothetical protein